MICKDVMVPPAEEGGIGICSGCQTPCAICGRVREISNSTVWCGIHHSRHRNGFENEQIYFDWICWECILNKSMKDYLTALYGARYVQLMTQD